MMELIETFGEEMLVSENGPATGTKRVSGSPERDGHLKELIRRIRAGEIDLFEIIVEQYQGEIYKVAWRMTHNYDDASDVVQETLLRIYRALISWTGKAKFSTWVYRIALNTSLDFIRRQKKHYQRRIYSNETDENQALRQRLEGIEHETPRDKAHIHHQKEIISNLLTNLSPMQRKCFVLHYFQELSIQEISNVIRCSQGSVKRHIFRARERLKNLIGENENGKKRT